MDIKTRILEASAKLFYAYGLKSITMDDVCRELGMSKKTLYQHFTDKDDIIHTLLDQSLRADCAVMENISAHAKDAVIEIISIMKHMSELFSRINPNLFYDMQKYHPNAWKVFLDFKDQTMLGMVERNIHKGMEQGFYRPNLDARTLAKLRIEEVTLALDPRVYPPDKFNLTRVQLTLLEHFLFGIATLKGHRLINKHLQIHEEE